MAPLPEEPARPGQAPVPAGQRCLHVLVRGQLTQVPQRSHGRLPTEHLGGDPLDVLRLHVAWHRSRVSGPPSQGHTAAAQPSPRCGGSPEQTGGSPCQRPPPAGSGARDCRVSECSREWAAVGHGEVLVGGQVLVSDTRGRAHSQKVSNNQGKKADLICSPKTTIPQERKNYLLRAAWTVDGVGTRGLRGRTCSPASEAGLTTQELISYR